MMYKKGFRVTKKSKQIIFFVGVKIYFCVQKDSLRIYL